ncbi:MAG: DUF11 domain-containing protein, partial [Paracoccaceae bacterium]
MRTFVLRVRGLVANLAVALIFMGLLVGAQQAQAQSSIEFNAGGGTASGAQGVTITSLPITLRANTDNPAGTTFIGVSPAPVPTATFTLLNQQYTLPTNIASSGTGLFIGSPADQNPSTYFGPLNGIGSPANANFTALPTDAVGTGINTGTNYGVRMTASAHALHLAGAPTTGRIQMADLDIEFNVPVSNPMLHLSGLGGSFGATNNPKGFTSEFDILPGSSVGASGWTLKSTNGVLAVSGNSASSNSVNPGASCTAAATDKGACGTVQVIGDSVTKIRLRVYLRASKNLPWSSNSSTGAGDAFYISVSTETADMSPAFSNLPAPIVPGTTHTGLTLTCTNAGPNTARNASCTPTANIGTISALVCTPAVPADISAVAPNNTTVCTFSYALPLGGTETEVIFTGQTGANNDRNGGAVGTAGNNQVQTPNPVRAPKLRLVKTLNGTPGRDQATDQFTLSITGTGGPATTTTGGTGTTVTNGTATLATATAGQTYSFAETLAGTSAAANYTRAYSCSNALAGGTSISPGSGASFTTPALISGDDITCTYTNTFLNQANLVTVKTRTSASATVNDGDTVTFAITVTNAGPAVARNISLTDILPASLTATANNGTATAGSYTAASGLWSLPSIASGGSATLTLEGTVKTGLGGQTITNTTTRATSDATDPTTTGDDLTESVTVTARPEIALVKTGAYVDTNGNGRTDVGDRITYAFTVRNTGNVTLTNVTVTDPLLGVALTGGPIASLAPGAVNTTTFAASYLLTQANIDAGTVQNQATASGTPPTGPSVTDVSDESGITPPDDDPTNVALTRTPSVALLKTSVANLGANARADAGDTISYTYVITNTGNTTVFNTSVAENPAGFTGTGTLPTPAYVSGGGNYDAGVGTPTDLRPTETSTFTATYTLTQADVNAGTIANSATASSTSPTGTPVTDVSGTANGNNTPTTTPLASAPSLALVKTGTLVDLNANGRADPGDRINYTLAVTNTGNVTLNNVSITDPLVGVTLSGGPIASLAPGAVDSTTITASIVLTQAHIDAGSVVNQATASGTPPTGPAVTDTSDESGIAATDNDPTTVTLPKLPSMTVDKRLAVASPTSFNAPGVALAYEFLVTNTGNTTITAQVAINDPLIPSGITCPAGPIAPGGTILCTGTYTTVLADINAGGVTNTASAYTGPIGSPTLTSTNTDAVVVPAIQAPALTLTKSTLEDQPGDFFNGNSIDYNYLVLNSGNVTITAPITVSDNLIPSVSCPALPVGGLLPGASINCTGSYTLTAGDIAVASTTNNATATDGTTTSPVDTVTIPNSGTPALSIVKTVQSVSSGAATFNQVGQTITYNYQVTNTGTAGYASDVTIFDDQISPISGDTLCFDSVGGTQTFDQLDVVNCPATYTVTQADMDRGFVLNEATAKSIFAPASPNPTPVQSLPDTANVAAATNPELTVTKSAAPASGAALGATITYTIIAENTGDVTLSNVVVTDSKVPVLTCDQPDPVTLAPGSDLVCTGPYTVTQADIDAEVIDNTATADAVSPQGTDITADDLVS